jgi:hypothetical protein
MRRRCGITGAVCRLRCCPNSELFACVPAQNEGAAKDDPSRPLSSADTFGWCRRLAETALVMSELQIVRHHHRRDPADEGKASITASGMPV